MKITQATRSKGGIRMKIKECVRVAGLAVSMALMAAGAALAGTTSGSLPVSAGITNSCHFGTINSLSFTYDPVVANASSGSNATSTATFGLACTSGDSITIGLSLGAQPTGTQRYMIDSGTDKLSYNLYSDSGYSTAWNESSTVSDTGAGATTTYTVYGSIPKGQNEPAATYNDTVSIDVTY
jgi:spore coat protein U-like protein